MPETSARLAYIVKGWPRVSELFIASEVHRLEQLGVELRIFALRPRDEEREHAVVGRIRARVEYLPRLESAKGPLLPWLWRNAGPFLRPLARLLARRPLATLGAALEALRQAHRERRTGKRGAGATCLKEYLHAVALADRVLADPTLRHLHAHFCHGATTVTAWAAHITGHRFSFTAHAKDIYQADLNPARLLARKLRAAAFAVTCTEANRKALLRETPSASVHTVFHGLNADLEALLAELPSAPRRAAGGDFRVIGVGRLVEKKGFDLLIEAIALLRARGVAARLDLVGPAGDASDLLRSLARSLAVDAHVAFRGEQLQRELLATLRAADVFCLPCRVLADGDRDGIPNVLVEAMACGLPVVTTAVSGIPELVTDGIDGLLVPANDAAALADALLRLHEHPALAHALSARARATVRVRFDGARCARQLAALFAPYLAKGEA